MKAQKFIDEQANDSCCCQVSPTVRFIGLTYGYDRNGFLRQTEHIDRAVQKVVHTSLRERLLYKSNYVILAEHPCERRMHNKVRRKYYWLHMANEIYTTLTGCRECLCNKLFEKHRRPLQIFSAGGPLLFVVMVSLIPVQKTLSDSQFVLVMVDLYS